MPLWMDQRVLSVHSLQQRSRRVKDSRTIWSSDVFFSLHRTQENQWQSISELNSFVLSVQLWTHEDHTSGADTRRKGWLMHLHPLKAFDSFEATGNHEICWLWCVNSCPNASLPTASWDENEDPENIFLYLNSCRFQQCHRNDKVTSNSQYIPK